MGLLRDGMTMLNRRLAQAGGVVVQYARGGASIPLPAVPGETTAGTAGSGGAVNAAIDYTERDYTFEAAALVLNLVRVEPRVGDRVTETINGVACVFELADSAGGLPAWRYSDQTRTRFRVHAKRCD